MIERDSFKTRGEKTLSRGDAIPLFKFTSNLPSERSHHQEALSVDIGQKRRKRSFWGLFSITMKRRSKSIGRQIIMIRLNEFDIKCYDPNQFLRPVSRPTIQRGRGVIIISLDWRDREAKLKFYAICYRKRSNLFFSLHRKTGRWTNLFNWRRNAKHQHHKWLLSLKRT